MCGLGHVSSMKTVVVGYIQVVVILQRHHIRHKRVCRDLKRLEQVSFLLRTHQESEGGLSRVCFFFFFKKREDVLKGERTDLEDGIHDAGERTIVGIFRHGEDIQAPLVEIF